MASWTRLDLLRLGDVGGAPRRRRALHPTLPKCARICARAAPSAPRAQISSDFDRTATATSPASTATYLKTLAMMSPKFRGGEAILRRPRPRNGRPGSRSHHTAQRAEWSSGISRPPGVVRTPRLSRSSSAGPNESNATTLASIRRIPDIPRPFHSPPTAVRRAAADPLHRRSPPSGRTRRPKLARTPALSRFASAIHDKSNTTTTAVGRAILTKRRLRRRPHLPCSRRNT